MRVYVEGGKEATDMLLSLADGVDPDYTAYWGYPQVEEDPRLVAERARLEEQGQAAMPEGMELQEAPMGVIP